MPDVARLAEQPGQLLLVWRDFASEPCFQLEPVDHPEFYPANESCVNACISDKAPAFGAGIGCRGTRCDDVTQQSADAALLERLQRFRKLKYRFLQILAILGK